MDRRSARTSCGVCGGPVELRFPGNAVKPTPEAFTPTNHATGTHGDLYRCSTCASVQQPSLPEGRELEELYRAMGDEAYLAEERGRRITANRLLDLIAPHVPSGRLFEVGCGHGLLMDEARRRGYEVEGIDLSATAAGYARDVLGLDVHEVSLADFASEPERFNAIVMADVIEHFDDPTAALDRCVDLLAPGGVLCVVTPDPSSLTARLAGRRWWGLVPAHTYLLPRRTLRELLGSRGLVISLDRTLVRTFSLRYWVGGLAERAGAVAPAIEKGGKLARRLGSASPSLSLSLGDERVVLGHKAETLKPPKTLATDRGGKTKVHVVLPAHNASSTIPDVASDLPLEAVDRALLVDDHSRDETAATALREGFEVIRHPANSGYGANQKTCYVRATLDGADIVVMVHADHQYDPKLVAEMVRPIEAGEADVVIGSRLLEDEAIAGGMPRWKWVGNRFLTSIENMCFRRRYSEYHTGYRAFSTELLASLPFLRNSDGFVFDQEIFAQIVSYRARVVEIPIPTRYFLGASSVSFTRSVEYGLRTLLVLARFRIDKHRRRWALLRPPAVDLLGDRERARSSPIR